MIISDQTQSFNSCSIINLYIKIFLPHFNIIFIRSKVYWRLSQRSHKPRHITISHINGAEVKTLSNAINTCTIINESNEWVTNSPTTQTTTCMCRELDTLLIGRFYLLNKMSPSKQCSHISGWRSLLFRLIAVMNTYLQILQRKLQKLMQ